MTVVIDVGCARYGGAYSIERLVEEFDPDVLYGFDPNAGAGEAVGYGASRRIVVSKMAAWTYDGSIGYTNRGTGGTVMEDGGVTVPCVDLAKFISRNHDKRTILKIDAEGAEYPLLEHLIDQQIDRLLELAWVEWHPVYDPGRDREQRIRDTIGCELADWRF